MWSGKQVIPSKKTPSPYTGKEAFLKKGRMTPSRGKGALSL